VTTVWYHKLALSNILSLAKVKREYEVSFDSGARNCFEVAKKDRSGKKMVFNHRQMGFILSKLKKRKNVNS
jgi:hypothetical protein